MLGRRLSDRAKGLDEGGRVQSPEMLTSGRPFRRMPVRPPTVNDSNQSVAGTHLDSPKACLSQQQPHSGIE